MLFLAMLAPARFSAAQVEEAAPPYAFDQPAATFTLPRSLGEISGLAVLNDSLLAAVHDEGGTLYLLRLHDGSVYAERPFGPDDDYEALATDGRRIFILSSSGTLTIIEDWTQDALTTQVHPTGLDPRHDFEGLAYDEAANRLLMACKACYGKAYARHKAIFAYELAGDFTAAEPAYLIDAMAFAQRSDESGLNKAIRRIVNPVFDLSGYKPSGLAIHPLTKELFILSSGQRAVAVLTPDGALTHVWTLPARLFNQPEGITFLSNGDLLISNEGNVGRATIVRYHANRK